MDALDILLFPIYVALFYFLFSACRKNYTDPLLQHYHKQGFWLKILGVLAFTFFNTKLSIGDSLLLYYSEGANFSRLILHDFSHINLLYQPSVNFDEGLLWDSSNAGYLKNENNYMVVRFSAFFSFFRPTWCD